MVLLGDRVLFMLVLAFFFLFFRLRLLLVDEFFHEEILQLLVELLDTVMRQKAIVAIQAFRNHDRRVYNRWKILALSTTNRVYACCS